MAVDSNGRNSFGIPRPVFPHVASGWGAETGPIAGDPEMRGRWRTEQLRTKRALDVVGAVLLLIAVTLLLLAVAMLVRLDSSGPILFRQQRIGLGGRVFVMYKFRTMSVDSDAGIHQAYYSGLISGTAEPSNGVFKLSHDPRVTNSGGVLRRFSLDELPQLMNVLRGDMSLVGPRPPIPYEVEQYGPREWLRLEVPPGLTGLWQVSGRNLLDFQQMIELDLAYIERWSIWLDLWIMARTPFVVLAARGAS